MGQTLFKQSRLNSQGVYQYIEMVVSAMEKKKAKIEGQRMWRGSSMV